MRKKNYLRFVLCFCLAVCSVFVFCVCAKAFDVVIPTPNSNQPDAAAMIKELNIIPNYAILEGQTLQMQIEDFDEFVILNSVEWSSSKPDVISCTKKGEIKGLKEGKATITVKAKVGNATDSITVYCARKINNPKTSRIAHFIAWTCQTPTLFHVQMVHVNLKSYLLLLKRDEEKLNVKGVYGSYFYVEFVRNEKQFKGFILQNWMPGNIASNEVFRQLSTNNLDVFVNLKKDSYKVTTNYKGTVKWTVSDTSIISFNSNTGEVIGKKAGIATISATVENKTLVCTVHSIYRWPLDWTGAARQETCVYKSNGNTYKETSDKLAVGEHFTVKGDMGGNSSWAYGVSEDGTWGFIPISHLSTKNTISYYNGLNWEYPLQNIDYNYLYSPYSPRKSRGDKHRGFDISTKNNQESILGKALVAPFDGTVTQIGKDLNTSTGCGYYICITSNDVDPVTGKKIVAIYQHMKNMTPLLVNDKVEKGETIVGYVGSTGASTGPHLHFEVNNMNAVIGNDERKGFAYTINPIYFYMDMDFEFNMGCSAVSENYGFYWYNENVE